MSSARRFEELECWQSSRKLAVLIYEFTKQAPASKDFGFKDQIQRSAVSVMSNIAEGFESRTQGLFIEFLGRAKASAGELRAQLYIAKDVEYISGSQFEAALELAETTSKQLYRLIKYLQTAPNKHRISEDGSTYLA